MVHKDCDLEYAISTHTPLAGRDTFSQARRALSMLFQLTRPSRGVTAPYMLFDLLALISTHTPLAGRDIMPGVMRLPS